MSAAFIDRTGDRYGRLLVTARAPKGSHAGAAWHVVCDCGRERVVSATHLASGHTISCGCFHKEQTSKAKKKHGLRRSRAYRTWANMLDRCRRSNSKGWKSYGGRGVTVCPRWTGDFGAFWSDIGHLLDDDPAMTIERIDNDGNYCPENCRVATRAEQARNKRKKVFIDTPHGKMRVLDAASAFGIEVKVIRIRMSRGWPTERLLERPRKWTN